MKNKKLITAVILTIIALSTTCNNLQKYDDENDFIVTVHDKTVEITGYKGTKTDVNIPPRIGKLPVTVIGDNAFFVSSFHENKEKLTSVKIPNGVTVIGGYAFYNNNLSKIIIPDTVVSIGSRAFAYNKLVGVKIPNTVTEIGNGAFEQNVITEIVLPDRITVIQDSVFRNNKLTSITIPESVVIIGNNAFENNELTELTIPRSVISIDTGAFNASQEWENKNNITKVTISDNVKLYWGAIRRFNYYYDSAVMERGGTYIYSDHYWQPEDRNIPIYVFDPDDGWESPDIQFLLDMPDLKRATLHNNDFLTDITPLSELTKIEILSIIKCPNIKSIKPLSSLVNLESLTLTHNNNYDYRDIASLHLQKLEISTVHGDEIDLGSIGQLHYLNFLSLDYLLEATTIKNINELKNLTNLETLDIRYVDNLDLSWATNLRNLTELNLWNCSVKDISPLANLPNLVKINLLSCRKIKDITPLLRSNSIKYVGIYEHDVEGGISDNIRSRFKQKGIELVIFHGDH